MPMGAVIEMLSSPTPANRLHCAISARPLALKALLALAVSLVAMLGPGAAQGLAVVTTVEGSSYGVTPPSTRLKGGEPETFQNEGGHPIVSEANVYAIYWDPDDQYHGDWQQVIDTFLHNAGAASGSLAAVFAVDAQYTDKAGEHAAYKDIFHGAYTDVDAYPTSGNCNDPSPLRYDAITCLTDAQIQSELKTFITQHSLPTGMKSIFYVLTPPGVTVCLDKGGPTGHCSDFAWGVRPVPSKETGVDLCRNSKSPNEIANCSSEAHVEEEMPVTESYENSFCSYHSAISPGNPAEGDSETILYATIPWTAGGLGDGHLAEVDQAPAYFCQDGGFNPASKPDIEERESPRPAEQEPNQIGRGPDGYFDHGLSDLIINQIAVEQQDTVTDPLLDGWHDAKDNEVMDECRNFFAPTSGGSATPGEIGPESTNAGSLLNQTINGGSYYLNTTFNLAAWQLSYPGVECMPGVSLLPQFTAPNTVNSGELVGFNGMESDITLDAGTEFSSQGTAKPVYATYTWNFGDGSPTVTGQAPGAPSVNSPGFAPCSATWEEPCAASTYHSYQYGGTYTVTLTVTDTGGNTANVTEPITVDGPPAPSPTPTPTPTPSSTPSSGSSAGAGGSSGSGGSGGGISSGQGGAAASVPPPVVSASVSSTSLKKVKSSGIAVRYSVNEQVAGSVQVLLESSIARRLGIKGPVATGLAKGSPSSIVIGTAVLVTTKAGDGTIRIKFASKTAARLARGHKLKLTLRLVARNASRAHPQTTTTLSTVVLSG
jgi:PKD repeat protein